MVLVTKVSCLQEEEEQQQPETYGSMSKGSLFYYVNTIVGSGVIGISYALHRSGFYLGIILLVLVAVITDYSLILMVCLELTIVHWVIFNFNQNMSDTMCSFMWKIYIHGRNGSSIWKNWILSAINFTIYVSIFRFVNIKK